MPKFNRNMFFSKQHEPTYNSNVDTTIEQPMPEAVVTQPAHMKPQSTTNHQTNTEEVVQKEFQKFNVQNTARVIPLSDISPSQYNDFTEIDKREDGEMSFEELCDSISAFGLLSIPLINYRNNQYYIISGERRIAAVKALGWTEVLCSVVSVEDIDKIKAMIYIANLVHRNLNPYDEIKYYSRLKSYYKNLISKGELNGSLYSHLSDSFNVSARQLDKYSFISNPLDYMDEADMSAFKNGDISINKAYNIIKKASETTALPEEPTVINEAEVNNMFVEDSTDITKQSEPIGEEPLAEYGEADVKDCEETITDILEQQTENIDTNTSINEEIISDGTSSSALPDNSHQSPAIEECDIINQQQMYIGTALFNNTMKIKGYLFTPKDDDNIYIVVTNSIKNTGISDNSIHTHSFSVSFKAIPIDKDTLVKI